MLILRMLHLKARLLVAALRTPRAALGALLASALAVGVVVGLWAGAGALAHAGEALIRRVVVLAGAAISLSAFLVPFMVVRSELLEPRALRIVGLRQRTIAAVTLALTLFGPAIILVPVALAPLALHEGPGVAWTLFAAPFIVVEGVFAARLGAAAGAALAHHPVWSGIVRGLGAVLIAGMLVLLGAQLAPAVGSLAPASMWRTVLPAVLALAPFRDAAITDALAASPLGAFWLVPLDADRPDALAGHVAAGLLLIAALAVLWWAALGRELRATRRKPIERAARIPGWFRRLPSTPLGAVAARSLSYWRRDPRYRVAFALIPAIPVFSLLAMWVGGIPMTIAALVPLPVVVLLMSWATLHNDVAYDHTAFWSHVAAPMRGVQDRAGRAIPVLAMGAALVLAGTPLTVWGYGDAAIAPAVIGVCGCLLLAGVGVSSVYSARSPYPATRPGDPAWQQPQVPGSTGGAAQLSSLFVILLIATPAIAAAVLAAGGAPGPWAWLSFGSGLGLGLLALAAGIRLGGAIYDRRAPELLAFTMRH